MGLLGSFGSALVVFVNGLVVLAGRVTDPVTALVVLSGAGCWGLARFELEDYDREARKPEVPLH